MDIALLIIGIVFSIVSLSVFFFKKKFLTLICFLITNLLMLTQYLLQGRVLEIAIVAVAIIKTVVFMIYTKKQIKPSVTVIIIFEVAMLVCGIITWSDWFSVLFLIASMLNTYASWQDNMLVMRILYIVSAALMITNYICTGLYANIFAKAGTIVSALCGIIIYDILKRKKTQKVVATVSNENANTSVIKDIANDIVDATVVQANIDKRKKEDNQ